MIGIVKIHGQSMAPALSGGDFVVTSRYYRKLSTNDLIIFKHPIYGRLIKRIKKIDRLGNIWVRGENKYSLSSEQMGIVAPSMVQAKVLFPIRQRQSLRLKI